MGLSEEEASAVFQTMMVTALADGRAEPSEVTQMHSLVRNHPQLEALIDPGRIGAATFADVRARGGEAVLTAAAGAITSTVGRELAFELCVRVMRSDGDSGGEEADVLGTLQELFALKPEDVKRLIARATQPMATR